MTAGSLLRHSPVVVSKKTGGHDELLADFVSLVATFAGRLYGLRSAANRKRLLTETTEHLSA